jgi:mRNA interferase RelE/StbE
VNYTIRWRESAERDLQALPRHVQSQIMVRVEALADNPRPPASVPLKGTLRGLRRVRVAEYRIAYLVDDAEGMVGIVAVGHRSRFYEELGRAGV